MKRSRTDIQNRDIIDNQLIVSKLCPKSRTSSRAKSITYFHSDSRKGTLWMLGTLLLVSTLAIGQGRLVLNGGVVNITKGANLVIANSASNAITRTSGYILSEGESNKVKWNIGTTTGTYTVPWGFGGTYIPLTFTKAAGSGASGNFVFSTYKTGWQNSAQLPTGVANMNGVAGLDFSNYVTDRFWQVNAQGYTTKPSLTNLVITYLDAEVTTTGNTITESSMKANRYNGSSSSWTDNILASTINTTNNTVTVTSVSANDLQPWWVVGTLGANRYWVSSGGSSSNLTSNWSQTPGGAGNAGVPSATDVIVFDGAKDGNCVLNADLVVSGFQVNPGYSGTITQGTNKITITNAATFSGGVFLGGANKISVAGPFTVSGAFFASTADTLELKGDCTISSGTFAHNSGTVKFSGTSGMQRITGAAVTDFNNLTVTNTSAQPGLSIESSQNMAGVLTLANNVTFDADGSTNGSVFTMLSSGEDPTQDASVAMLQSGARVSGKVTVQRFMAQEGANNGRIYRYISSPVSDATVADIQNEIPITGPFTGTSVCSGCSTSQTMFAYDESAITDTNASGVADLNDGYVNFPAHANTETLTPGKGYTMFIRGNILSSTMWDVRGPINTGNVTPISIPVTFTSSGQLENDGWNLVGNPLPSTIDWDASAGWTKTNLDASIYITDNGGPSSKVATWNGIAGTNGGSQHIAMGQAFWVKANGDGAPSLIADENVKASGKQTTFFRQSGTPDLLRITMSQGAAWDDAVVNFRSDATPAFDHNADAMKLKNQSFNISTMSSNNDALAINSWSALTCDTKIKINITDAAQGHYTLTFKGIDSFLSDVNLLLEDKFTNASAALTNNMQYAFDVTSDAASQGSSRFLLTFHATAPAVAIHVTDKSLSVDYQKNIQWYLDDQPIAGATQSSIIPAVSGTYRVVVSVNGCELSGSVPFVVTVVTGVEPSLKDELTVFPNPVSNSVTVASPEGIESATLMNTLGGIIDEVLSTNAQGDSSVTFSTENLAAGLYLISIKVNHQIVVKKIVKK
jgi:hypothetical protein